MSQPLFSPGVLILRQLCSPKRYSRPETSCCGTLPLSQQGLEQPFKQDLNAAVCEALSGRLKK